MSTPHLVNAILPVQLISVVTNAFNRGALVGRTDEMSRRLGVRSRLRGICSTPTPSVTARSLLILNDVAPEICAR